MSGEGIREAQFYDVGDLFKIVRAMYEANDHYNKFTFDDESLSESSDDSVRSIGIYCLVEVKNLLSIIFLISDFK